MTDLDANWVKVSTCPTLFAANSDSGLLTSMNIPNAVRTYETSPINEWYVLVPREFEVDARKAVDLAAALTAKALRELPSPDSPGEDGPPDDYQPETPAQMREVARARSRRQSSLLAVMALLMFLASSSSFLISVIDMRRHGNRLVCDALHCFGSIQLPIGSGFLTLFSLLGLIALVVHRERPPR